MGTLGVTTTGQISHNQTLESGKSYSWKVQCDTSSATYSSDIYNLTVLGAQQNSEVGLTILSNLSSPIIDAGEIRNRLESAITNIEGLDMESKNDAGSLQVSDKIDAALQTYDRAMRDINNIIYRRDLTVQEQQDKKQEYYNTLQALENITPYNVKTISHDTFISYPLKSELINISEDYRAQKKIVGKLDSEKLMVLQNKLIVTSRVSNVEITYINGRTEVLTLVVKELKLTDNATDTFLLEAVPKDFAASSDDIVFLNDVKIINKDPLIRMDKQNSTIYYVSKQIDLAVAKRSQTMVMSDSLFSTKGGVSSLTGAVTFTNIDFTSPTSLIVIVVIISCLYMVYAFDLFGSVFGNGKNKSNKKVEDILNLIRDAKYFLQTSEVNKADMVFAEIKLRYEIAPDDVKAEVYNESMSLLELIDSAQLDLLIKVAEQQTMYPAEQEEILSSRDALKRAYELLSDQLKNKYVDRINSTIDEENSVLNSWHTRSQTRSVLGNQNNQSYQNNKNNQDRGNV